MLPYLDELIGVDFIFDMNFENITDPDARIIRTTYDKVKKGKIKDPRGIDSTQKSRTEFYKYATSLINSGTPAYSADLPNDWSKKSVRYTINALILEAKIYSITLPQDYPNTPYYMAPEFLDDVYNRGLVDKLF